jgi:[acyl-carrier-protein] S-malonyltransferase
MAQAQAAFNQAVDAAAMQTPRVPVIGNVQAQPLANIEEIRMDLKAQLTNRVRWTESIEYLRQQGVSRFAEIGSGNVLGGLLKRIDRQLVSLCLGEPDDLAGFGL